MANKGKKISELTALTSASLQTTLVGVDNGTTYKVTLDVLEDAIISMVSRSTDLRLDSLEEYTSSFTQIDIPIGTISSSAQISNFGFISSSHTNIASLNSFTQSQDILNSAFTNGINARLQTSSFNEFSSSVHSEILAATNEQSFNGLISGSSQLTSSYDERYLLSGSITQTTWDNIGGKPDGIVSQSVDIADFTFTPNTIQNSNVTIVASDGDIVLNADGNVYKGSSNAGNGLITDGYLGGVIGDTNRVNNSTGNTITDNLDNIINSIPSISSLNTFTSSQEILNNTFATTGSNILNGNQTINGAFTISTPSAGVPNGVSNWNGGGGWNQGLYSNLATTGGTGIGLTVNVVTEGSGYIDINSITINTPGSGYTNGDVITIDNENNIPGTFTISIAQGSGWTFNTSGSLTTPGDINVSGSIYADNLDGLISSSAQITTFGFISSSQTINTSSFATTGSNTFIGTETISGSLNVTGSTLLSGYVTIGTGSGDEGGEILLAKSQTNNSITGSGIVVDIFQNKLRIFEQGGNFRGAHLTMTSQSVGVDSAIVTSPNLLTMQTITSASYAALTPVSGTLYIIIG